MAVIAALESSLASSTREAVSGIELSENLDASERACHLELLPNADPSGLTGLTQIAGLTGATCAPVDHPRTMELWGSPFVIDQIAGAHLSRHVRSFFQGNRFLIQPLVEHVMALIEAGPTLDRYAGVGLFSVPAAIASCRDRSRSSPRSSSIRRARVCQKRPWPASSRCEQAAWCMCRATSRRWPAMRG